MSDLPKYSRSGFDTTETDSLVKGDRRGSLDGPAPSYPPTAGSSSNGLANITYTFIPQWPVPGKRANVLGVLGRNSEVSHLNLLHFYATFTDDQETIDIVRRAFPQLKEYADERIQLEVGMEGQNADQWSAFMDEAWPRFATQPPTRMKITVADAPGDAGKRELLVYTASGHKR